MSDRTTIVIGLGATGYSCIRHLAVANAGESVLAIDTRSTPPFLEAVRTNHPAVEVLSLVAWPRALARADRVVVSPGIAMDHCLVRRAAAAGVATTSDIELFLSAAAAPVVGITGTNGKSTVTALVGELLAANGLNAPAGGNLGTPALDLLDESADAYVLELSSFQLERLGDANLAVAAILNVTPDHQDRYPDVAAYAAAKQRIYAGAACAVYNADDALTAPPSGFAGRSIALNGDPAWRIDGNDLIVAGERLPTAEVALRGRHNHFNALAAAAIARGAGPPPADALAATRRTFARALNGGLPHRSRAVAEICGVAYIDDSKATNAGATLAALEGFGTADRNVVLIAGGDAKGGSFEALAPAVARHVSRVILIGRDAGLLARALDIPERTLRAASMRDAVRLAARTARGGQTVLLSPACASFDMYENYQARGDDFAREVALLTDAAP